MTGMISLLNECTGRFSAQTPLVLGLFLGGLAGSVSHCAVMCGPFVAAQTGGQTSGQAGGRWLFSYHAGRIATYTLLGAFAGAALLPFAREGAFGLIARLGLCVAAMTFFALCLERVLGRLGIRLPFSAPRLPFFRPVCAVSAMSRAAKVRGPLERFTLGALLGLLPCGLVFAALTASAATANPLTGAAGMAAFGLGTVPALLATGFVARAGFRLSPPLQDWLAATVMAFNGLTLLAMATR